MLNTEQAASSVNADQSSSSSRKWNPYIHGSNSAVLMMMKGEWTLSPALTMIKRGVAPPAGELDAPHLMRSGLDAMDQPGYISLGRLVVEQPDHQYGLEKVSTVYPKFTLPTGQSCQNSARSYVTAENKYGFESINKLLIHMARAKQLGVQALTDEEFNDYLQDIHAHLQLYRLFKLFGRGVYPNIPLYQRMQEELNKTYADSEEDMKAQLNHSCENWQEYFPDKPLPEEFQDFEKYCQSKKEKYAFAGDVLYAHFTFDCLLQKVKDSAMDLDLSSFDPDNTQQQQSILNLVQMPDILDVQPGLLSEETKKITLPNNQWFVVASEAPQDSYEQCYNKRSCGQYDFQELRKMVANAGSLPGLQSLVKAWFSQKLAPGALQRLHDVIDRRIEVLEEKKSIFEKIHTEPAQITFSEAERTLMRQPFPLIFVSENVGKIKLFSSLDQEYRSREALKLGEDIKMVATDSKEHQWILMKYFKQHHVRIEVVLIDQLKASIVEDRKPVSAYTHEGGIQRLSFFAAQAMSQQESPSDVTNYPEEVQSKLTEQIDDAKGFEQATVPF